MKVAILGEFPSQPANNTAHNIKKYSSNEVNLYHRYANLSLIDADVIFYFNILDMLIPEQAQKQMIGNEYKLCTTVRSWRIIQNKDLQDKLKELEQYITVLSANNKSILEQVKFEGIKKRMYEAPDPNIFRKTHPVSKRGKLRVGYVGTFREDKRYKSVLENLFKKYEQIIETKIYGNAGTSVPITKMVDAYNDMDILVMPSRWEGAPLPPLEAALCGRMTVGTECGDLTEIFDYKSSSLFPIVEQIPSTVVQFEEVLIDLYTHRNDAVIKGEEARKVVLEKRNWGDVVKFYDNMFEETLDE
jgi:glycosyltransferase involved in cell wall biosynthesis